jgi:hypothetical protein
LRALIFRIARSSAVTNVRVVVILRRVRTSAMTNTRIILRKCRKLPMRSRYQSESEYASKFKQPKTADRDEGRAAVRVVTCVRSTQVLEGVGTHTEISSKTHYSVNINNICDAGGKGPRPAKRRKPRSAPAVTASLHPRFHPSCCLPRPASRLTTRSPKLITDIRQHSSITSPTIARELIEAPLLQLKRDQLRRIRNGASNAFSNAPGDT